MHTCQSTLSSLINIISQGIFLHPAEKNQEMGDLFLQKLLQRKEWKKLLQKIHSRNLTLQIIDSWGPMILGHAYEPVVKAIQEQAVYSTSYGAPTELEIKMAELIKSMVPNVDLIRMVSSGTEACMSAIRVARGYTGKNKIIKFEGCYHGHADSFLVKAGSGVATFNIQTVPGVTAGVANDTLTCAYNDLASVEKLVEGNKNEIAAIIVEPVAGK